jgi:hypothetical protein
MSLLVAILVVGFISSLAGLKKPLYGGISGLISFLFLFYQSISDILFLYIIIVPLGFLFGLTAGFISYMIFSNSGDKENHAT